LLKLGNRQSFYIRGRINAIQYASHGHLHYMMRRAARLMRRLTDDGE
jgi:hypothetical protein